ncbi:DUF6350 family protein [Streptomyces sp. TRM 70351]|uniref:cell division protein PerM n=1 Tax=Streptomyces sp. TRM 70351 TaxID=3116552 RepID=UPI002E7B75FF|nr:DUF6350 family protein [Streptomyces sp. TRM 70351]MEE1927972.1 DUF6350 family protein [Streptomyces sp. TRM 70351]
MSRLRHRTARRRVPRPVATWLVEGAFAAVLGLAAIAMLALLLWITSPYPDSGPGGALRTAAGLWLLAHGADLVRTDTPGGVPAPVGVTPLLLTAVPVFLLHRLTRTEGGLSRPAVGWLCAGYTLTGAAATGYATGGPLRVDPLSAALHLPVLAFATLAVGSWVARGRPALLPPRRPGTRSAHAPRPGAALRSAAVATAALCGAGALLVAGALLWHAGAVRETFPQLTDAWSGRLAVALLCLALAPNVAVWAAAYGLGPGFALGTDGVTGPLAAVAGLGGGADGGDGVARELPPFPLLAALPDPGPGGPLALLLAGAVPLAAGVAAGWCTARSGVPVPGTAHGAATWRGTLATAFLGAAGCGLAMAALAACAGGPLGTGALAQFGPVWWQTGAAALAGTALPALPAALVVRLWRLRDPHPLLALALARRRFTVWCRTLRPERHQPAVRRPGDGWIPDHEWYATGARLARWTAIKESSGGLVPDFEPAWPAPGGPPPAVRTGPEPEPEERAPGRGRGGPGSGRPRRTLGAVRRGAVQGRHRRPSG